MASLVAVGFSEVLITGKIAAVEVDVVSIFVPLRMSASAFLGEFNFAKFSVYLMSPLIGKTWMVYSPADKPSMLEELLIIALALLSTDMSAFPLKPLREIWKLPGLLMLNLYRLSISVVPTLPL